MRHLPKIVVLTVALALSSLVSVDSAAAASQPKHGGTLVIASPETPRTLNSAIQSGVATGMIATQLFASPLRYDADWRPHPYLAKSWKLSPDDKTLTLHLVHNAVFHDGTPITSADVAFSIMTLKKHHPFSTMYASVTKVSTPDPYTAVIHMSKPNPAILLEMSPDLCPILPKHVYDKGNILTNPHNTKGVVGSGPFKLVAFKPGQYVILKRFDKFFIPGRPYLDKLVFKVATNPTASMLAVEHGQVDVLTYFLGPRDIKQMAKDPQLVVSDKGFAGIGSIDWIEFNLARKPFNDIRVRHAVAYAINKKYLINKLFQGTVKPATGPIFPGSPFYTADVEKYPLNLKKAEALLDAAGYKPGPDGVRLHITMDSMPPASLFTSGIAEYVKAQLKNVGIDVTVRTSPDFPTWAKRMAAHNFQMSQDLPFNWGDPNIGVARIYLSSNIKHQVWTNVMSYRNAEVDKLLTEASTETNLAKRKALYAKFQKIVVHDMPILYLTTIGFHTIYNKNIANMPTNIWGMMSPLDKVYWKVKKH